MMRCPAQVKHGDSLTRKYCAAWGCTLIVETAGHTRGGRCSDLDRPENKGGECNGVCLCVCVCVLRLLKHALQPCRLASQPCSYTCVFVCACVFVRVCVYVCMCAMYVSFESAE